MEIELKYLLTEAIAKDRVLEDKHLQEIQDPDSEETIHMRAIYFDTADNSLRGKEMAFRVREENDRRVATLKWGGSAGQAKFPGKNFERNLQGNVAMSRKTVYNVTICSIMST